MTKHQIKQRRHSAKIEGNALQVKKPDTLAL